MKRMEYQMSETDIDKRQLRLEIEQLKLQVARLEKQKVTLTSRLREMEGIDQIKSTEIFSLNQEIGQLKLKLMNTKYELEKLSTENDRLKTSTANLKQENSCMSKNYDKALETIQNLQKNLSNSVPASEKVHLEKWEKLLIEKEAEIAKRNQELELETNILMRDKEELKNYIEQIGNRMNVSQYYQNLSTVQGLYRGRGLPSVQMPLSLPSTSSSLGYDGFLPITSQLISLDRSSPYFSVPVNIFPDLKIPAEMSAGTGFLVPGRAEDSVKTLCEASAQTDDLSLPTEKKKTDDKGELEATEKQHHKLTKLHHVFKSQMDTRLKALQTKYDTLKEGYDTLNRKYKEFKEENNKAKAENSQLTKEADEYKMKIKQLKQKRRYLKSKNKEVKRDNEQLQQDNEGLVHELIRLQQEFKEQIETLDSLCTTTEKQLEEENMLET